MPTEDSSSRAFDDLLDRALRGEPIELERVLADNPGFSEEERRQLSNLCAESVATDGDAAEGRIALPSDAPPIDRIGTHRLVRRIGAGAMGAVFLARDDALGREVAIKILGPDILGTGERGSRFLREVRAAGRLRHPNIVTVHSAGEQNGLRYMVMEFIPGSSLQEVMASPASRGFRPPVKDVLRWGLELAHALEAAHQAGIVHRDVKPSNIRITDDRRAVLLDFGLARDRDDITLTEAGSFRGSPQYASPEQVDPGLAPIDARTDVYSLAATLYELLTGAAPFRGETREQVFNNILTRDPVPLRRIDPSIPRDLETVILAALDKAPARRPQTAAALAADLQAIQEGRPVSVRPPSPAGRVLRWARRHRAQAGLALALLVSIPAIAALGGFVLANLSKIQQAESDERARDLTALIENGYLSFAEDESDEARQIFAEALRRAPDSHEAYAGYALALIAEQNFTDALSFLDTMPEPVRATYWSGRIRAAALRWLNRIPEADAIESKVGAPGTAVDEFLDGYIELQFVHEGSVDGHAQPAFDHFHRAVMMSRSAVRLYHFELGHAAGHARRDADAKEIARVIKLLWPESPELWFAIGRTLKSADPAAAMRAFENAANPPPHSASMRDSIVLALNGMGSSQRDVALALARTNVADHPTRARAHYALGRVLRAQNEKAAADQAFRECLKLDPGNVQALHHLVEMLQDSGSFEASLPLARDAARKSPPRFRERSFELLGLAAVQTGQVEEAIVAFSSAAEIDPENPNAACNLGTTYLRRGEFAKGLESLRRGHEIGSRRENWEYPSAQWVRDAEQLVEAEKRLEEVRRKSGKRAVPREKLMLAVRVCHPKKLFAEGAALCEEAIREDPSLLAQRKSPYCAFVAARHSVAAGCGKGVDAPNDDAARTRLRTRAREWFAAEIAALEELLQDEGADHAALRQCLSKWLDDSELGAVRSDDGLAAIPAAEAAAWRAAWARCAALQRATSESRPSESASGLSR